MAHRFTITNGKIIEIEAVANPDRLRRREELASFLTANANHAGNT
jgi:hypothetical protein